MSPSGVARLDLDDDPWWLDVAAAPASGALSHATYAPAGTVVVVRGGREVALADAFPYHLVNQYCYDSEYYLVLRVRTVLAGADWRPGDVCVAFDTFHELTYVRGETPRDGSAMSYGGDWDDLQLLVDTDHPHPEGPRPTGRISDATVLRAVRDDDLTLLHHALSAGGNPNAGFTTPPDATRSVSLDRETYALVECRSTAAMAALLAAGATVDGPGDGRFTPLQALLLRGTPRPDVTQAHVLLEYGANPDAGRPPYVPRTVAATLGAAFTTLFEAY